MVTSYPPERHLLRDLRFTFGEHADGTSVAWLPVIPEVCTDAGSVRAGALATLVDVLGGGLAATAAHPNWIATADLTVHLVRGVAGDAVEARARVLRAGRTTVVIEVALQDDDEGRAVGVATMSFSVLPRREINPDITTTRPPGPSSMALSDSGLDLPLLDALEIRTIDAARGVLEAPVVPWALNSMGAMQGGVVATLVDAAGETALRHASGERLVVTDIQMTYLAFGKAGPIRTAVNVLSVSGARGVARIEVVDAGSDARRMAVARVTASHFT
jgi:uncharacterized protein (TIGR00369 family)